MEAALHEVLSLLDDVKQKLTDAEYLGLVNQTQTVYRMADHPPQSEPLVELQPLNDAFEQTLNRIVLAEQAIALVNQARATFETEYLQTAGQQWTDIDSESDVEDQTEDELDARLALAAARRRRADDLLAMEVERHTQHHSVEVQTARRAAFRCAEQEHSVILEMNRRANNEHAARLTRLLISGDRVGVADAHYNLARIQARRERERGTSS